MARCETQHSSIDSVSPPPAPRWEGSVYLPIVNTQAGTEGVQSEPKCLNLITTENSNNNNNKAPLPATKTNPRSKI